MAEYIYGFVPFEEIPEYKMVRREEVVRCRDCKHYTPESVSREERSFGVFEDVWEPGGCFNPKRCPHGGDPFEWYVVGIDTEPDGFCAWGERKEDA